VEKKSSDPVIARDRLIRLRPSADSWVDWATLGGIVNCTHVVRHENKGVDAVQ
jgi:hypothetical protein